MQPYLPCCDLQPLSRLITPEERIISFKRTKWNHDKLPCDNNSLTTTRQSTLHIICINFQVGVFSIVTSENLGLSTQFEKR